MRIRERGGRVEKKREEREGNSAPQLLTTWRSNSGFSLNMEDVICGAQARGDQGRRREENKKAEVCKNLYNTSHRGTRGTKTGDNERYALLTPNDSEERGQASEIYLQRALLVGENPKKRWSLKR